jgi:hypothetical protein
MFTYLLSKPVLIGLHLAIAVVGIDAFLWYLGELIADPQARRRMRIASIIGVTAFLISWMTGGYYYVMYYGSLVKPIIKEGLAPWAHLIWMETKEHIFLFIPPLAMTAVFTAFMNNEDAGKKGMRGVTIMLVGLIVFLGLAVGAMGFIVSAAARWGVV